MFIYSLDGELLYINDKRKQGVAGPLALHDGKGNIYLRYNAPHSSVYDESVSPRRFRYYESNFTLIAMDTYGNVFDQFSMPYRNGGEYGPYPKMFFSGMPVMPAYNINLFQQRLDPGSSVRTYYFLKFDTSRKNIIKEIVVGEGDHFFTNALENSYALDRSGNLWLTTDSWNQLTSFDGELNKKKVWINPEYALNITGPYFLKGMDSYGFLYITSADARLPNDQRERRLYVINREGKLLGQLDLSQQYQGGFHKLRFDKGGNIWLDSGGGTMVKFACNAMP